MLKQVQHDTLSAGLRAKRLTADTIRSLRDDKVGGWPIADILLAGSIRFFPSVGMKRIGVVM